mgnify:CR=1 FL=1
MLGSGSKDFARRLAHSLNWENEQHGGGAHVAELAKHVALEVKLASLAASRRTEDDLAEIESYVGIFDRVAFVELRADLDTRLARNRTDHRLLHKASKRDVEWSDDNVRQMETEWRMTSADGYHVAGELLTQHPHLVLDTDEVAATRSAALILEWVETLRGTRATSLPSP